MKKSIIATMTAITLYTLSASAMAAHQQSDNNSDMSYAQAHAEQARVKNMDSSGYQANLSIPDYSYDEDDSYAARRSEQARLKSLAGKQYKQPVEQNTYPVSPGDDPRGIVFAESRRNQADLSADKLALTP